MKLVDKCEIPIYIVHLLVVCIQCAGLVLIALVTMLVTQMWNLYLCCHHKKCITIIILV